MLPLPAKKHTWDWLTLFLLPPPCWLPYANLQQYTLLLLLMLSNSCRQTQIVTLFKQVFSTTIILVFFLSAPWNTNCHHYSLQPVVVAASWRRIEISSCWTQSLLVQITGFISHKWILFGGYNGKQDVGRSNFIEANTLNYIILVCSSFCTLLLCFSCNLVSYLSWVWG